MPQSQKPAPKKGAKAQKPGRERSLEPSTRANVTVPTETHECARRIAAVRGFTVTNVIKKSLERFCLENVNEHPEIAALYPRLAKAAADGV